MSRQKADPTILMQLPKECQSEVSLSLKQVQSRNQEQVSLVKSSLQSRLGTMMNSHRDYSGYVSPQKSPNTSMFNSSYMRHLKAAEVRESLKQE